MITGLNSARGPTVRTIVGEGLFKFDDNDGRGAIVRLQHCLGLAYANGPALHRRHLQQQDQGLRPEEPLRPEP